ncbi:hypothetical protein [Bartonella sp. B1099]|uniref:hypothetical protein n=1 Tax=Bartonella sp. B1099 TaxID=2911422 RepID=UPI0020C447C5|nr:hypothetical protein [Bartonella sp. B1099]
MTKFYVRLRVSYDNKIQTIKNLGLLEYANKNGFVPLHIERETINRRKEWCKYKAWYFNRKNRAGELLLTPKFSHIADFSFNILENFKAAN